MGNRVLGGVVYRVDPGDDKKAGGSLSQTGRFQMVRKANLDSNTSLPFSSSSS